MNCLPMLTPSLAARHAKRFPSLAGTANALADIAETPAELERQRGAVIAGMQAIDRLMPKLHTFSLAAGSLELDNLLHSASGMGTADVRRALGMQT